MGLSYNPSATVNGLLLNVDFANPKSYTEQENLFLWSEDPSKASMAGTYIQFVNTSTTLSPVNDTSSSLIINGSAVSNYNFMTETYTTTTNGIYTMSFHVKPYSTSTISMILGTNGFYTLASGTGTSYAIVTINPIVSSMTYRSFTNSTTNVNTVADFSWGSSQAANGWTRYWMSLDATTTTFITSVNGGFYVGEPGLTSAAAGTGVYTWGWQLESSNAANTYVKTQASIVSKNTRIVDMISRNNFTLSNPNYVSINPSGYLQNHRYPATTSTVKTGGGAYMNNLVGGLSVTNFLYYDHTWEVWARVDDINPTWADGTEGMNILTCYPGYHAGYMYDTTGMYYYIWSTTTSYTCALWTIGTGSQQIKQGNWVQLAVTRTGNDFVPYVNGVQAGTGYTRTISTTSVVTNNQLVIGAIVPAAIGGGSYRYYSKSSVSLIRMYNRALSADEIKNNFSANRGRFGL